MIEILPGAVRSFPKNCGHQVVGGGQGELGDHLLRGQEHQGVGPELHLRGGHHYHHHHLDHHHNQHNHQGVGPELHLRGGPPHRQARADYRVLAHLNQGSDGRHHDQRMRWSLGLHARSELNPSVLNQIFNNFQGSSSTRLQKTRWVQL